MSVASMPAEFLNSRTWWSARECMVLTPARRIGKYLCARRFSPFCCIGEARRSLAVPGDRAVIAEELPGAELLCWRWLGNRGIQPLRCVVTRRANLLQGGGVPTAPIRVVTAILKHTVCVVLVWCGKQEQVIYAHPNGFCDTMHFVSFLSALQVSM